MKNWFKNFFTNKKETLNDGEFPIVWDKSAKSIYQFLLQYKDSDQLPEIAQILPDESHDDGQLKWAAGALDGVMTHHNSSLPDTEQIDQILMLFTRISTQVNKQDIEQLYLIIKEGNTSALIDSLIEKFLELDINFDSLYQFLYWLLLNTPDREVVKFSIALLGSYTAKQTELFQLFGMHEEFTLYSAVALNNTIEDRQEAEDALLCLAKKVHGWGRIHLVERLARAPSAEVKDWLLREGYKNSVMFEYLAYTCATAGELKTALEKASVDMPLLTSTANILEALIMGGPAEDMHDYDEGASVCLSYLAQLQKQPLADLSILRTLLIMRDFVAEQIDDSYPNWDENTKIDILNKINSLITSDNWLGLVEKELLSNDNAKFWIAADVYTRLGFDAWQARFDHQKNNSGDQWFYLMKTDDLNRIQQTIQLAKKQNDFSIIATGPELKMGFGPEFKAHGVLDFILQELSRFSGVGEDLILIGLNSPVIRNRNMALSAIEGWDKKFWSDKIKSDLQKLVNIEPDADIKNRITALLDQS